MAGKDDTTKSGGGEPPSEPPEIVKGSVITVNFKEGRIVGKVQYEAEGGIPKFLRDMARFSKSSNVKSVIVLTINDEDHVDWVHIADTEHHLALAALCLDDIKEDLKAVIFSDEDEELEE